MSKVSVGVLVLVMGLAFLSGNAGSVFAYSHSSYGGYRSYGGYWGCCSYSYYYPYYAYCGGYYWGYYGYCPYYGGYNGYYGSYGYYNQQYQLTVNTDPSTLSNVVGGGGQYAQGSSASFSANQNVVQVSQDTRYVFSGWTGDYSGSSLTGSVTMSSAKTITAVYQLQYYLSVSAQPSNAPSPQGSGWFNAGSSTMISSASQIVPVTSGTQLVFNGWNVDGNSSQMGSTLSVQMNAPHTVVAQYTPQYYLTVSSNQGSVSGQGWYDAGTNAQISTSSPQNPSYGINMVFNGWQGAIQSSSQSTTVLMDGPKSVTATWVTDSTVLYATIGLGLVAIVVVAAVGAYLLSRRERSVPPWQTSPYVQPAAPWYTPMITPPPLNANMQQQPATTTTTTTSAVQPAHPSNTHRRRTRKPVHPTETQTPEETPPSTSEN